MRRLWRGLKWFLLIAVGLFVTAQAIRPARTNPASDPAASLTWQNEVDPKVVEILDRSCGDCHSNNTRWPWYANVAPISWFVIGHVNDARRDLNFSEWARYTPQRKGKKLQEICDTSKSGVMPLSSYTPLHSGSKLSDSDVAILCDWTVAERKRLPEQNK
ncbi:MAG: heme-binding domain-containing protein [Pyrinomonadaceae bacterium]